MGDSPRWLFRQCLLSHKRLCEAGHVREVIGQDVDLDHSFVGVEQGLEEGEDSVSYTTPTPFQIQYDKIICVHSQVERFPSLGPDILSYPHQSSQCGPVCPQQ